MAQVSGVREQVILTQAIRSELKTQGVLGHPEVTMASFLHDTQLQQRSGETPDFSNTLFLLDESSMVGNTDMARAYALIAAGGGRAVASGDTDQLQAIAPGQPFRLQQTRSAADVAIMKEIVRQTPELREAVYSLITGPRKPHSASGPDVDVSGRAWSLSVVCSGVGAESVPPCAYQAVGH